MQMLLSTIWQEMEMTCSQLTVLAMFIGETKIHQEEVPSGLKVLLTKIGK